MRHIKRLIIYSALLCAIQAGAQNGANPEQIAQGIIASSTSLNGNGLAGTNFSKIVSSGSVGIGISTLPTMRLELRDTLTRVFAGDTADTTVGIWLFRGTVPANLGFTNCVLTTDGSNLYIVGSGYQAGNYTTFGLAGSGPISMNVYGNGGGVMIGGKGFEGSVGNAGAGKLTVENGVFSYVGTGGGYQYIDTGTLAHCPINTNFTAYSAGTVYTMTASYALLDFGTTDPSITIQNTGTYLVWATANLTARGATYAATNTFSLKLRRTSGTAADVSNSERVLTIPIITTTTQDLGIIRTREATYTATAGDVIQAWGVLSATPSVGNVICDSAEVFAVRIY